MKKTTELISFILIFQFAIAQHVEYYPSSQRYFLEIYHKPAKMTSWDSLMNVYPFNNLGHNNWNPIHNYQNCYFEIPKWINLCQVSNMDSRSIYGIAVPCNILTVFGNYIFNRQTHNYSISYNDSPYSILLFDSISPDINIIIENTWSNFIDTLQHRSEADLYKMWLLRPNGDYYQPWLIDSVSAIPEWNMITDSKFRFPNLWLDDSVHTYIGNKPNISLPTLEVYFEQPYIVQDSFIVGIDFFPINIVHEYNDSVLCFPSMMQLRDSMINECASTLLNAGYCNSNCELGFHNHCTWNGIFPILVPPSGCYKPGVLRASVIGYDSAVVEWMSRFWLPESRVEYGPAGFAPDSGTVIEGVTGNRITLHGLSEDTDYEVRVSNWCDSAYSDETVCLFRTALRCEPAGEESLFVATDTTIQLAWEMPDSASWCEVEWGPEGFVEGEGTLLPHVTRGYLGGYVFMQHLAPATRYDVRVRCWCQHSQAFSPWREYNVATRGRYTISVASNNDDWGHVTGAGVYMEGERAMLNAVPASGVCHFRRWHDGETSNPRFVEVSGDSLFTAVFINDTVPVSVAAPDAPSCLTLRPNPASDRVEVMSCEVMSAIDLYDVTGRAAAHIEPRSETATLDVSALASGVYTVRATTQSGIVYTDKLLVTRL